MKTFYTQYVSIAAALLLFGRCTQARVTTEVTNNAKSPIIYGFFKTNATGSKIIERKLEGAYFGSKPLAVGATDTTDYYDKSQGLKKVTEYIRLIAAKASDENYYDIRVTNNTKITPEEKKAVAARVVSTIVPQRPLDCTGTVKYTIEEDKNGKLFIPRPDTSGLKCNPFKKK